MTPVEWGLMLGIIFGMSAAGWKLDKIIVRMHELEEPELPADPENVAYQKWEEDRFGIANALGDGAQWSDELNQCVKDYKYLVTCDALEINWEKFEIFIDCALREQGPPPKYLGSDETVQSPNFYADPTVKRGLAAIRPQTDEERQRRLEEKVVEALQSGDTMALPEGWEVDQIQVDQRAENVVSLFRVPPHHLGSKIAYLQPGEQILRPGDIIGPDDTDIVAK